MELVKVGILSLAVFTAVIIVTVLLGNFVVLPSTRTTEQHEPHPLVHEAVASADPEPMADEAAASVDLPESHEAVAGGNLEPMVLSLSYWEQTANALGNLADLQCWARAANISKVVEPSVTPETPDKSVFHFTQNHEEYPRFRDLFNISNWNEHSVEYAFSPLESQEYFLQHAMKDLVYVWITYKQYPTSCKTRAAVAKQAWYKFLMKRGFNLIKTACIDFSGTPSHIMSEESFRDKIFQSMDHNVTVVFGVWRGIRSSYRIALNGTKCINSMHLKLRTTKTPAVMPPVISYSQPNATRLLPSLRVQNFVDQFMSEHLFGDRYIVVMLRTGKFKRQVTSVPPNSSSCAGRIISDWKKMAISKNITKTLFFSDIGKHGLTQWSNVDAMEFSQYVQNSIKLTLSRDQVNSILEGLTGSEDSVLIALIQQQLVARATCVVMAGGGSFQSQTLHRYFHLHKGQECYSYRSGLCDGLFVEDVYG